LFGSFASTVVLGAFTFSGFVSAAALSDETQNPQRSVPLGIIRASVASAVLGMIFLIAVTMAGRGSWGAIGGEASPVGFIAQNRMGTALGDIFIVCVAIAIFGNSLLQTTIASRVIWAVSRDDIFPASHVFHKVNRRMGTPANAILLAMVCEIVVALLLTHLSLLLVASSLIPVGVYGAVTVAYLVNRKRFPVQSGGFSLGRFDVPVTVAALAWSIFLVVLLAVPKANHKPALVAIGVFASGLIWWAILRIFAPERLQQGVVDVATIDTP
jgi:amino acid transporter